MSASAGAEDKKEQWKSIVEGAAGVGPIIKETSGAALLCLEGVSPSTQPLEAPKPDGWDLPRKQLVFFVRHAESRWNKAQAEFDIVKMMQENDHGLSDNGRIQAESLRARIAAAREKLESNGVEVAEEPAEVAKSLDADAGTLAGFGVRHFLEPDVVFSSPFTRAITTSCLALRDLFPKGELILLREAREQKNMGGADSTGVAIGTDIAKRVEGELKYLYQGEVEEEDRKSVMKGFYLMKLDYSSAMDKWWGDVMGESKELIYDRTVDLVKRLRQVKGTLPGGGGTTILCAHSLVFKATFQTYLNQPEDPYDAQVASSLKSQPIPCCGVIGVLFEWDEQGTPMITEVVPLLGTELKPAKEDFDEKKLMQDLVKRRQGARVSSCACVRKGVDCSVM